MGGDQNTWHLANIWENIAAAIPDKPALIEGDKRYNWAEYTGRAARLAQVYTDHGLNAGAKLAIYSHNSAEYMEAQYAAFKARICPVNINYRYLEAELLHVITNSDSEALIFQARFAPRIAAIRAQLSEIKLYLQVADDSGEHLEGSVDYEQALQAASPMPVIERSGEDIYMFYTGGTTGMPKGVMFNHETFTGAMAGRAFEVRGIEPPTSPEEFGPAALAIHQQDGPPRSIPVCPLMHATGMWIGAMIPHSAGGAIILSDNTKFDPHALWKLIEDEAVSDATIVGDVFAKPMLAALDEARDSGKPYDVSSVNRMSSSGVMWSAEVKAALLGHIDMTIIDSMGATEGGMASSVTTRETAASGETAKFELNETSCVLTEEGKPVKPGSGEIGFVCNGGMVPLGYYKDEAKSAATFKTYAGTRYAITGDYATVEADGSITLLGRGSICINSGGEKIFPEEVEEVLKRHNSVYDCLVVGLPDDRFGESVTAVLSAASGSEIDAETLKEYVRTQLADYKAPRRYVVIDEVPRAANGKADYKAAKAAAVAALDEVPAG